MAESRFDRLYYNLSYAVKALFTEGYDEDVILGYCRDIVATERESAKNLYEAAIVDATQEYIKAVYPQKVESYSVDELRLYARRAVVDEVDQCVSLTKFLPLPKKL